MVLCYLHEANFVAGTRFTHIGRNEEDGATRLGLLLHYAIRVKHFNSFRGYSDRLEIKSRTPFSDNAVQYQGKESSVLRAPDHSLWYGSEEEAAVQLVVLETDKCDFECSQKLRLCPCCEAEVLGNMGEYCPGGPWKICTSADISIAMVYSERKRRGEAKCGLYGLLTDHKEFLFYHVNDDGDVRTILPLPFSHLSDFFFSSQVVLCRFESDNPSSQW